MQANADYIINSLGSQIARLSVQVAERDAIIAELQQELDTLKSAQIDDMDGGSSDIKDAD